MLSFILRRLLLMIPTTFGIAFVVFSLFHLAPGDPALIAAGNQADATLGASSDAESTIEKFRRENDLDRHFIVQFFDYVGPINLSPNGHPWFSSPRTERIVEETDIPGSSEAEEAGSNTPARTITEGRPVPVEHVYTATDEERKNLDRLVGTIQSPGKSEDDRARATEELLSYAKASDEQANESLARLMQSLFEHKLSGPSEVPVIDRMDALLAEIAGERPELAEELTARDGKRHLIKRWFAWYFTDKGAMRTQNSGDKWYSGAILGDLGKEFESKDTVATKLVQRLKVTVPLALVSIILTYIIALPLGIFSVRRQGTASDGVLTLILFVLYSIPTFWAGLMLLLIFGKTGFDLLPVLGLFDKDHDTMSTMGKIWDVTLHAILPIVTLTYGGLAYLSRQMRAGMLDTIRQDYIRTARAKGLSEDRVIYKHALRNSMIPVLTLLASILPILVGGALIVEVVFSIQGMGSYAYEGLTKRDFNIVMATTLFVGIMTQFGILLSDIAYALVDPRIRLQ